MRVREAVMVRGRVVLEGLGGARGNREDLAFVDVINLVGLT
jgi:hypothetical protein